MQKLNKGLALFLSLIITSTIFISTVGATIHIEYDKDYTFSENYKSGRYYDNLMEIELTGDGPTDVLAVALSQLGYNEGNNEDELHGENGTGKDNFVEYNLPFPTLGGNHSYAWCAAFVSWCLRQAGVPEDATAGSEIGCDRWLRDFQAASQYISSGEGYAPVGGDIIFFTTKPNWSGHVGIVLYSDSEKVYTIEGNTIRQGFENEGGGVHLKSYSLDDERIMGYGLPKYETNPDVVRVDFSNYQFSAGLYTSEDSLILYENTDFENEIATIEAYNVFTVANVTDDAYKIIATTKDGTFTGYSPLMADSWHQMTCEEEVFPIKYNYGTSTPEGFPTIQHKKPGVNITLYEDIPSLSDIGFVGWSINEDKSTVDYLPGDIISEDINLELYAVWDENLYTITFQKTDGTIIKETTGYYGHKIELPDMSEYDNFLNWAEDISLTIKGDMVYTANFKTTPEITTSEVTEPQTTEPETSQDTQSTTENNSSGCKSFVGSASWIIIGVLGFAVFRSRNKKVKGAR